MNFDELRARYFEELATEEGCASAHLFESAIAHARGIQSAGLPAAGIERKAISNPLTDFALEISLLTNWSTAHNFSTTYRLESLGPHDAEGTEHRVWYEGNRVRKISFASIEFFNQGPYGQTVQAFFDHDLEENEILLIENRKASPSEYLERLYLQNLLFNIDNRLEGFSPYGFEITQPLFAGQGVTWNELQASLEPFGFEQTSQLTWHSPSLEIAISDVALHNVIAVEGVVFPFDIWARRIRP